MQTRMWKLTFASGCFSRSPEDKKMIRVGTLGSLLRNDILYAVWQWMDRTSTSSCIRMVSNLASCAYGQVNWAPERWNYYWLSAMWTPNFNNLLFVCIYVCVNNTRYTLNCVLSAIKFVTSCVCQRKSLGVLWTSHLVRYSLSPIVSVSNAWFTLHVLLSLM